MRISSKTLFYITWQAIFLKITSKSIFNSMFICICRAKEEDDEIMTDFASDKFNSRDCICSFLSN